PTIPHKVLEPAFGYSPVASSSLRAVEHVAQRRIRRLVSRSSQRISVDFERAFLLMTGAHRALLTRMEVQVADPRFHGWNCQGGTNHFDFSLRRAPRSCGYAGFASPGVKGEGPGWKRSVALPCHSRTATLLVIRNGSALKIGWEARLVGKASRNSDVLFCLRFETVTTIRPGLHRTDRCRVSHETCCVLGASRRWRSKQRCSVWREDFVAPELGSSCFSDWVGRSLPNWPGLFPGWL